MADNYSVTMDSGQTGPTPPEGQQPGTNQNQDGENQRPEWLPEKFNSPDELAKAYAELEARMGRGEQGQDGDQQQGSQDSQGGQDSQDGQEDQQSQDSQTIYSEQVDKALNNAGIQPSEVQKEYSENGGLTDETYSKLEQAGYPREMVDAYVQQMETQAQQGVQEVMQEAGGEDQYNNMVEWAKANLSQDEITEFNKAVNGGQEAAKWAVRGLAAKYQASEGSEPGRQLGGRQSSASSDTFRSTQQVVEAMKDSRYQSDPAYRQYVQEKLSRSNVF